MSDQVVDMSSVLDLKGVGPKCAEALARLSLFTVQDLLFHLPSRYEDRTEIKVISSVRPGDRVLIEGMIYATKIEGARRYLRVTLVDHSRRVIDLVFFHFTDAHQKKLSTPNLRVRCFGEVRQSFSGQLEMMHPEYASVANIPADSFLIPTDCLVPIYPTTQGVTQKTLRNLIRQALAWSKDENGLIELLPAPLLKKFSFCRLHEALQFIHFPPAKVNLTQLLLSKHPAQQRLIFEELLAYQLSLQQLRQYTRSHLAVALKPNRTLSQQLLQTLPFTLTNAQKRVVAEMKHDLTQAVPMMRLVQGDVGSGKTIVACFAALQAIEAGFQVALMAPTEILAQQHYYSFQTWLKPLGIAIDYLVSRQSATEQKNMLSRLQSGATKLIIGTHALFQKQVHFNNLALLIIDEQHRFGVQQRLTLMEKGMTLKQFPHQLIMTATPIPRTLMMSAYADLDCSVIDELPPGRKKIQTILVSQDRRDEVITRVRTHCQSKKQVYWVCTLIEESDVLQCQAAQNTAAALKKQLPELQIGLVHGRLSSEEKNAVMMCYQNKEINLLVATTVIEVGVDVSNASLMIIENSERLGLAQLHQLRGRVGRGTDASFCVLLFHPPLSENAKKRLMLMRETNDGFEIAKQDLNMRGPGELLGTRQSGLAQMRVADLERDQEWLPRVQSASQYLLNQFPEIAMKLVQRWLGAQKKYIQA